MYLHAFMKCTYMYIRMYDTIYAEGLGIANVDYYWYLNQSGTYTVDGTDDKKDFEDTLVS